MGFELPDFYKAFGYTLSLPERLVRSAVAAVGGASKLLTDTLVPEPLRKTTLFTALVGNTQRFLIEKIAEVDGVYEKSDAPAPPEDFVRRAVAGNIVNAAGLFAVHLSPLWVFAFITDMAHGTNVYLARLVEELKKSGVLASNEAIHGVDELLTALGKAGKDTAQVFDLPPVDLASLNKLRADLTAGYSKVFASAGKFVPDMDTLWKRMQSVAARDGVAVETVVGLMTLDVGKTAGKAVSAAFAVGNATTDLLSETIFTSYGETLDHIQRDGALACLEDAAEPFLRAISSQFGVDKKSWTEQIIDKVIAPFTSADEPAGESPAGDAPPPSGIPPVTP